MKTRITDGFLFEKQELNRKVTINAVYDRFSETGRMESIKMKWKEGMPDQPHIFWDSDVAKWVEAACYILMRNPDEEIRKKVEDIIDDIIANQGDDGYFNTYYTVVEPEGRFTNLDNHELYCAGHLIEAAIAHFELSGERRFLEAMMKYADYIRKVFVVEKSAAFKVPGHEQIELALIKLYRLTGEKSYLDTAMHFLNERGVDKGNPILQNHLPVRQQQDAVGHAVRALYLYCAMADAAIETGDKELEAACRRLFDDIYETKMYITGGVGSTHIGEAFTVSYDLPNVTAYSETCAAIALAFFSKRMMALERDSKYADCIERVLYNGVLSGISVDGKGFFYENPLEINMMNYTKHNVNGKSDRYPMNQRFEVFWCSCCPPNISRFIGDIDNYIYDFAGDGVYVNLFADSIYEDEGIKIIQKTEYPNNGRITFECEGLNKIFIRIPSWCERADFDCEYTVENGYAVIENPKTVSVDFNMKPVLYEANTNVRDDIGKVALMYGPVVYCIEGVDNPGVFNSYVSPDFSFDIEFDEHFGMNIINVSAFKKKECEGLYYPIHKDFEEIKLKFIPYSCFANRGATDMAVWVNRK